MILPRDLKYDFWEELRHYEEERHMPYITTVEQIGYDRGKAEGKAEGAQLLLLELLQRKLGSISDRTVAQIHALPLEQLTALGNALLDFNELADLDHWLNRNS
jgi:hypothetical protein